LQKLPKGTSATNVAEEEQKMPALPKKLKNKKLVELYQDLLAWEPHPELASYHISFLKNYLALLVNFQQH
jgi:hypothetical protein